MDVAIYARHSTERQDRSTADQIARCEEFCRARGYEVVDVFADQAVSGAATSNRPGVRSLIAAAAAGRFSKIVTEDLSRLSRDQADAAMIYKQLSFWDVVIESVSEGVITPLHIGLKSTMNALYLVDLADKTRRGQRAAALAGSVPGGRTYGYDIVPGVDARGEPIRGQRGINDAEAAIVRRIFEEYAAGVSLATICKHLNLEAIPAPKGGDWRPSTLVGTASRKTGMLRQTMYIGQLIFGRQTYRKHPETGRRLAIIHPEDQWLRVPVPELAIVEPELFERVQAMIEERSTRRRTAILTSQVSTAAERSAREAARSRERRQREAGWPRSRHYLWSGRLFCARHGSKIVRIGPKAYSCGVKGCFNRNLSVAQILAPIIFSLGHLDEGAIQEHFQSDQVLSQVAKHREEIRRLEALIEAERAEVRSILETVGRDRARRPEVADYLDERERRIRRLQLDLKREAAAAARLTEPAHPDGALRSYRRLLVALRKTPDSLTIHRSLRPFVEKIILSGTWSDIDLTWHRSARILFDFNRFTASGPRPQEADDR